MRSRDFNSGPRQPSLTPPTRWYPTLAAARQKAPDLRGDAVYWLGLEGSLTRALQVRCHCRFRVEVVAEGFGLPDREEARTLGLPPRQRAWIREVRLCGDGEPWVLARTIIPLATLQGAGRRLRHLGRVPLGAWLFSSTRWHRGHFQTGLCRARTAAQPRYARRSLFHNRNHLLLVGEYFLPRLPPV